MFTASYKFKKVTNVILCCFRVVHFPQVMKKILKASEKYPEWKKKHSPQHKPWLYPEQISLPSIPLSELSMQKANELENIDESSVSESKDYRNGDSEDDEIQNG